MSIYRDKIGCDMFEAGSPLGLQLTLGTPKGTPPLVILQVAVIWHY